MLPTSIIYLDHAATSHPKPEPVYLAADAAFRAGGSPGRGGHRLALDAGRVLLGARERVASLLGLADSARVVFTASATDSLNLALKGLLRPGDHCITTSSEHNALRRPLYSLERDGVSVTRLLVSAEGLVDAAAVAAALRPTTRLIALAHASNVSGALQPIEAVAAVARKAGVLLLVDAAQTAGALPIHMERMGVHLLAAPGHKGLLGPQGTGLLLVDSTVDLHPIREGGTGFLSAGDAQPAIFPEGFESGTANLPGVAGLAAGVEWLQAHGVENVRRHEIAMTSLLQQELGAIAQVRVYGPHRAEDRAAVVAFTIDGLDPSEVEERLDEEFGVIARAGLHCNPGCHAALGTLAGGGAVRLSPGPFTTTAEILAATDAVRAIAHTGGKAT